VREAAGPAHRREAGAPQALEREYLASLLTPDARRARQLVEDGLAAGLAADLIYLQVITPAMREIGRLWETASVSVAQEHLATQITNAILATLALALTGGAPVGAGRVALVASTPGERHTLGGQMVADFLDAQAWTVLALGADTPAPELVELARARAADVVALSTALPGHLLSVTLTCELLRRLPHPPYIVVGGRAYGGDRTRALAVGADAFADDPQTLLTLLADRFAAHAAD
jgi:MerR family transcriptional regulator, light-induced transcriptional regulator